MAEAIIRITGVHKTFLDGPRGGAGPARDRPGRDAGRDGLPDGAQRLGQDDAAQHRWRAGGAEPRARVGQGAERGRACPRTAWRACASRRWALSFRTITCWPILPPWKTSKRRCRWPGCAGASAARTPRSCSTWWGSRIARSTIPPSCRAGSSSAWPSRARWPTIRTS